MAEPVIVREIARALGESATLAEAAPRMLAAVCESLGWEVRRALGSRSGRQNAPLRRDVARLVAAVRRNSSRSAGRRGSRAAWAFRAGLGFRPARVDSRCRRRPEFSARGGRRPGGPSRRVRASHPSRQRRAGRDGVLQPRHSSAQRRAARHDDDRRRADWPVRRAEMGGRRAGNLLQAVARSAVCRQSRWLLAPAQSGVDPCPGLRRGGTAGVAVPRFRPS